MTPRSLSSLVACVCLAAPVAPALGHAHQRGLDRGGYPNAAVASADVPCPIVKVPPRPPAPAPSPVPVRDRYLPTLGGEALATAGLAVPPGSAALPGNLSATSWLVADMDSGDVIGACGAHEYGAPASLQKLLLTATVLPKLKPDEQVKITQGDLDFEAGSSAVGLILDGTYSVETIWLGLLLNSGNDAANLLARLGGGDRGVAGTLADMNAEAKRLGANDTHAETPHGLDGPGQVTSAYDLALISRACFAMADFRKYAASRSAQIPPQPPKDPKGYQIQNDNQLLLRYPGAMGGKTGFTDIARHTFVGAAERDGRHLVVTLLGAEHQPVRTWQQGAALLDWAFAVPPGTSVGHLVQPGEADKLLAAAQASKSATPSAVPLVRPAAAPAPTGHSGMMVAAAGGAVAVFVSVWLVVALSFRRRARRRAAVSAGPDSSAVGG